MSQPFKNSSGGLEFQSKVTKKALQLGAVPGLVGLYLLFLGLKFNHEFAWADSSRWMFVGLPLSASFLLFGYLIVGATTQKRKKVIITRSHVVYDEGNEEKNFTVHWKSVVYSAPTNEKQMIRTLLLASQDRQATIHDIFMPAFNQLLMEIKKRKNMAVTDSGGHTVIDSGKVRMVDPKFLGK